MAWDFDAPVNRRGTDSEKWDLNRSVAADVVPMWVADMDFLAPPEVTDAMRRRLDHGVYGYTRVPQSAHEAVIQWRRARCGQEIRPEWITYSSGVVCTMKAVLEAFTSPGDAVAVQTPVYPPFIGIVRDRGRRLAENPLVGEGGRWRMDFEGLERCFREGAKVMFLCSSHNPVGRVWTPEELGELARLCVRYDVLVASDEIHCDILRPGARHTAVAALPGMEGRTVTMISSTKSFNLAGLQNSVAVTADPEKKKRLEAELFRCNHHGPNLFGMIAQEAAWTHGGPWLDALNAYIAGNCDRALDLLGGQERIRADRPEGTYLLWLDCRALGLDEDELLRFFVERCRVYPTMGRAFGGEGFVRLNLATRRVVVEEAVGRIAEAVKIMR